MDPQEIKKGATVTVKGTSKAALNGTVGVAKDQNKDKSRWNVEFKGSRDGGEPSTVALKPGNLEAHGRGVVTAAQLGRVLSNLGEGTLHQSYARGARESKAKQSCES